MTSRPSKLVFDLTAGCLCLDFANTLDKRLSGHPEDKLCGYGEFVAFGRQTGVLSLAEARELHKVGRKDTGEASRVFRRAVELRELVFRIMSAVASGGLVSAEDAKELNDALREHSAATLVAPMRGQAAWRWIEKSVGAGRLLGRIVRSAVDVLSTEDILRVRRCAAETCCWLFLDRSRSHNRRWCEMKTCGSRQKAKAYYQRKTADRKKREAAGK